MFCKYCGKPIDEGTMRCRICGRPVGPLEGGNGFWDLKEDRSPAPAPAPAPEPSPAPEAPAPRPEPARQRSPEEIPTVTSAAQADAKTVRELRTEVKKLREELRAQAPQRRSRAAAGALLLALLAMALGAFVLVQMQTYTLKVRELESTVARQDAELQELNRAVSGAEDEQNDNGESKWLGFDQLAGLRLFYRQELFEGPNKGPNDPRGQSINLGLPENGYEETPIFTARFKGSPGTYRYYWVMVETNEDSQEIYFTPLKEEDGYFFHVPNASDADKVFVLSIMGEVKEEHLGRYAFVAEDTQTQSAYVSSIVELYNRADKGSAEAWADGESAAATGTADSGRENGGGNGN